MSCSHDFTYHIGTVLTKSEYGGSVTIDELVHLRVCRECGVSQIQSYETGKWDNLEEALQ